MKRKNRKKLTALTGLGAVGAGMLAQSVPGLAMGPVTKHIQKEPLSQEEIKNLYKAVGGKDKLRFGSAIPLPKGAILKMRPFIRKGKEDEKVLHVYLADNASASISHYDPRDHSVVSSTHAPRGVLAHEFGHSTSPFIKSKLGLGMYGVAKMTPLPIAGIAATRLIRAYNRGASKEEINKIKKQDDIAAFAGSLPILAEETRANLKALQALKRTGHLNAKEVLPAALSELAYLGLPAMTPITHKVIDWRYKKLNKNK